MNEAGEARRFPYPYPRRVARARIAVEATEASMPFDRMSREDPWLGGWRRRPTSPSRRPRSTPPTPPGPTPVVAPANARRFLSAAVTRAGGKLRFADLDADPGFAAEDAGVRCRTNPGRARDACHRAFAIAVLARE